MKKLVVAGCSVSDYTGVAKNYGEILSELLNRDYLHLAAGAGSNDRLFRVLTTEIRNNQITSDDVVIIQYTNYNRKEFWSKHKLNNIPPEYNDTKKSTPIRENYDSGQTIKFKIGAYKWQPVIEEKSFLKLYENNFINHRYNAELFYNAHHNLAILLAHYSIPCIYILKEEYLPSYSNSRGITEVIKTIQEYEKLNKTSYIDISRMFNINGNEFTLEEKNPSHFNQYGHETVAKLLFNKINQL